MTPTTDPEFEGFDGAQSDLRQGIECSRQIVRQSRMLIELSQADGPFAANDDEASSDR